MDGVNGVETGHAIVGGFENFAFEPLQIVEAGLDLLDEVDEWELTRALQGEGLNVGYAVAECVDRWRGQLLVGIVEEEVVERAMAEGRRRFECVMVSPEVSDVERREIRTDEKNLLDVTRMNTSEVDGLERTRVEGHGWRERIDTAEANMTEGRESVVAENLADEFEGQGDVGRCE